MIPKVVLIQEGDNWFICLRKYLFFTTKHKLNLPTYELGYMVGYVREKYKVKTVFIRSKVK